MEKNKDKILCERCSHEKICSLKNEYLAACTAISEVLVPISEGEAKRLCDMTYFYTESLRCQHYIIKLPDNTRNLQPL